MHYKCISPTTLDLLRYWVLSHSVSASSVTIRVPGTQQVPTRGLLNCTELGLGTWTLGFINGMKGVSCPLWVIENEPDLKPHGSHGRERGEEWIPPNV